MSKALVFPGQGSQMVGMGKALAEAFVEAKDVFLEVDDTLGQHLSAMMFGGDDADLMLTANAQPAIMASSIAVWRVLQKQLGMSVKDAAYVAGHSLGEYSALCVAETFSLADTARLLRIRGDAMQQAVPAGEGKMAAIIGLDVEALTRVVREAAGETEICVLANYNAPGQIVISGHTGPIERACVLAKEAGAKRALPLNVSAPFHSPLMQPAAERMHEALSTVKMQNPAVPLIANVTADAVQDAEMIRTLLVQQVTGAVRWSDSVLALHDSGVSEVIEIGTGKVLCGMVKRIAKDIATSAISEPTDIDGLAQKAA